MYIKVKDRELFKELENNLTIPNKWNKFIEDIKNKAKLIIKSKTDYECTFCHHKFNSDVKVNNYCKCPNCNNTYLVKSNRLTAYEFRDELAILDKYKDYYIVRQFRIHTNYRDKKYKSYCYEYARVIYDSSFNLVEKIVNENVIGTPSGMFISFRNFNSIEWRYFRSSWAYLPNQFIYYPYNLEEMFSDNKSLKYSQLWELAKHVDCMDLIYLIKNYNPSVELLTKLKLYNLALCPKSFLQKKTFEERFMGLSKDYLPFIQENNLNYDQLIILSYLKTKDMKYLIAYEGLDSSNLDELVKLNINLITLVNKTDFKRELFHEYKDYLSMAKRLKLNLKDKSILYPKHIKFAHDKALKEYLQQKDNLLNNSIRKRFKQLKCNEFKNNKYVIFPVKDFESLVDESSQQNNCVRTYAERIADGECDIYFMRLVKDTAHSLVTVEVKENKVVQKRTKNNEITTRSQDNFLKLWEEKILKRI